jgi:hypothetical protein
MVARSRWLLGNRFREGVDDVTWHPHPELVASYDARVAAEAFRKKPCRRVEFLPRKAA